MVKKKLTVFGALTSSHKFYYGYYDAQNSLMFMHFLRGLSAWLDATKKYVFIQDNAGFHKTSCVQNLLAENSNVAGEYLPSYHLSCSPSRLAGK